MTETPSENKNTAPLMAKYSTFVYTMLTVDIPLCLMSLAFGSWLLYKASGNGYLLTYGIAAIVIGILGISGNSLLLKKIRTGLFFARVNIVFTVAGILALATLMTSFDRNNLSIVVLIEALRIGLVVFYAFAISKAGDAFENLDFAKEEQQAFNDRYKKNV